MFFIPGEIISIVTFPGVIVHEFAHMFFCKLRKVAVFDACYFQVGNPAGYVVHESTSNFYTTFLISMGPFFINTLLCLLICLPAYMPIKFFDLAHPLSYFLIWLGVSIGMHAVPSNQDANNVYDQAKHEIKKLNLLAILSFPLIGLIYVFNVLRFVWADLFYGIAIGIGIPSLIFN
ncbi:metalloprotease family protein [Flavobacterium beibuense]|uniref:An1-type zinc finger protein n=1 Tax=Flavobacterium beibuense TaxID=657326 RepID=A0A444WI77_9FLAO|nr:metalloprotease family protein [Flavobacterium beibuense]RYJ45505.1 An1-type zinc finger protein [Flavobacterium beibuense]